MNALQNQMLVDIGIRIPMRDGINLVGDVYRPASEGRWPVILIRCPYDRQDPAMGSMVIVDPFWLARQGFVVVVQDTRGRGESEGEFDPVYQEVNDGYDSVEWAAAQPWSTGDVGMCGSSYLGVVGFQAAGAKPPHLKAVVSLVATTKKLGLHLDGGVFDAVFVTWFAYATALGTLIRSDMAPDRKAGVQARILAALADPVATASQIPLDRHDILSDPELAPFWPDTLAEPNTAGAPNARLLAEHMDIGDVALLHVGGYRDFVSSSSFDLATALAGRENHRFIAGPFTHRGVYSGFTGARELPGTSSPAGPLGWGPMIAAWFDMHLRGGTGDTHPLGLSWLQGPPVHYYVEGENRWEKTASWPPPSQPRHWYLTSGQDARSSLGDGRLELEGNALHAERRDSFQADPHDPFPSCGGATGIPEQGQEGIQDQRLVDQRLDLLVYTSDILEEPVRIAGKPELCIWFGSTAPDADICVTLVDVEPSGFAYNIAEGFQRTRYRHGNTDDWLVPDQSEWIRIALHNTAHVFKPGHRVRVMISGACYPRITRNLHTRTRPETGSLAEAVVATHSVFTGPDHRSCLTLPVSAGGGVCAGPLA